MHVKTFLSFMELQNYSFVISRALAFPACLHCHLRGQFFRLFRGTGAARAGPWPLPHDLQRSRPAGPRLMPDPIAGFAQPLSGGGLPMTASAQHDDHVSFDAARAEGFEKRIIDMLNACASSLMMSVGHRTGLFDAMADTAPSTSAEIADRIGLQERYVREWLGAMTVGGIIEHDGSAGTYALSAEHAAFITRSAVGGNLAVFAQYVALLGSVEGDVVRCFREGGGVPYERSGRLQQGLSGYSGQTVLPALIDHILPLVPGLT